MKYPIVSVFDKKTALYDSPILTQHVGTAIREWDHLRKDPQTKFGKNPEDFDLFQIGTFDPSMGTVENIIPPTHLASGV